MTYKDALIQAMDFSRQRLLGTLDAIEKSGTDLSKALAWRPAPGRAHIAWQAMHCAATHDRYFNVRILGKPGPRDEALCNAYAGGSTPADGNIPTLATIRETLANTIEPFRSHIIGASDAELARKFTFPNNVERTYAESVMLLNWHEAHHQGQIHITWNMYKAAHGIAG